MSAQSHIANQKLKDQRLTDKMTNQLTHFAIPRSSVAKNEPSLMVIFPDIINFLQGTLHNCPDRLRYTRSDW